MIDQVLIFIGHTSNIVGVAGALFSFLVWLKLRKQNKALLALAGISPKLENYKELVEYHRDVQTVKPYALAVSLLETSGSIKGTVEDYLKSKGGKWSGMPVEEINFDGLSPEGNLEDFINDLRKKRREFEVQNATEIHLFVAGPVVAGTLIGAVFDNWRPVKLYHKNRGTQKYEYWCPLIK